MTRRSTYATGRYDRYAIARRNAAYEFTKRDLVSLIRPQGQGEDLRLLAPKAVMVKLDLPATGNQCQDVKPLSGTL